jgi:hypothetical protein
MQAVIFFWILKAFEGVQRCLESSVCECHVLSPLLNKTISDGEGAISDLMV